MRKKKIVYCDYAAATPVDRRVRALMDRYTSRYYANPLSLHSAGRKAKHVVEEAQKDVARALGTTSKEIFFTSGATEANNIAILGALRSAKMRGVVKPHVVTASTEHSSILGPIRELEKEGVRVSIIPVDQNGIIRFDELKKVLRKETVLVSVMHVNNETGVIQPLTRIAALIKEARAGGKLGYPYLHTDASQSPRSLPINVHTFGVDMLTLDGAKMYGPKGIGILYVLGGGDGIFGVSLKPILFGNGRRAPLKPGTPNVPAIIGVAKALTVSLKESRGEERRLSVLKQYFIKELQKLFPEVSLNGNPKTSVSGILNVSFPGILSEEMLMALDLSGIYVSTASACESELKRSHVILALTGDAKRAEESIRFSFGRGTNRDDCLYMLSTIRRIVSRKSKVSKK